MPNVETIYQQTIRPLPVVDQVRLAELIMERAKPRKTLSNGSKSILEFLESIRSKHATRTAAEIDEQIRMERDSWDD